MLHVSGKFFFAWKVVQTPLILQHYLSIVLGLKLQFFENFEIDFCACDVCKYFFGVWGVWVGVLMPKERPTKNLGPWIKFSALEVFKVGSKTIYAARYPTVVLTTGSSNFFQSLHFLTKIYFFSNFFSFNATICIQNASDMFLDCKKPFFETKKHFQRKNGQNGLISAEVSTLAEKWGF